MTESPHRSVIALQNAKEAALYFDHVIPLDMGRYLFDADDMENIVGDRPWWTALLNGPHLPAGFSSILPPDMQNPKCEKRLTELNGLFLVGISQIIQLKSLGIGIDDLPEDEKGEYEAPRLYFHFNFQAFMDDYDLRATPVDTPGRFIAEGTDEASEIAITLASLELVDASNASWEQIFDFRQDTEARNKLRRLRLFALENYSGKSKAYIEDHISLKISDYAAAKKKWGFETKYGAFTMLQNSKILAGALAGTLFSAVSGKPIPAIASAAIGLGLEAGRIIFEVGKQRFALRDLMTENPICYISEARSTLSPSAQD